MSKSRTCGLTLARADSAGQRAMFVSHMAYRTVYCSSGRPPPRIPTLHVYVLSASFEPASFEPAGLRLLGHDDGVDDVDDPVGAIDVGGHNLGVASAPLTVATFLPRPCERRDAKRSQRRITHTWCLRADMLVDRRRSTQPGVQTVACARRRPDRAPRAEPTCARPPFQKKRLFQGVCENRRRKLYIYICAIP